MTKSLKDRALFGRTPEGDSVVSSFIGSIAGRKMDGEQLFSAWTKASEDSLVHLPKEMRFTVTRLLTAYLFEHVVYTVAKNSYLAEDAVEASSSSRKS
jgi:hypothetical protein